VQPIHDSSRVLYEAHIKILREVLEASRSRNLNLVRKITENAVLFEQGNTDQLAVAVAQTESAKVRGRLGDLFSFYVLCVGRILVPPLEFQGEEEYAAVHVYRGLEQLVDLALVTPERVIELVEYLSIWNKRVLTSYEELRSYCYA